jgi:hypothetical protein
MSNTIQIAGAVMITAGAALIFPPAGLIVGGLFAILIGMAASK